MLPESALYIRRFDGNLHPSNPSEKHLPVLTRVKLDRWSCYVPQGTEAHSNNVFHSVSNILRLTQDTRTKKALYEWETHIGKEEAKRIRDEAIRAGNTIHAYLHAYLMKEKTKPIEKLYEPYCSALKKLLPHFEASLLSEQLIVSFKHRYIGQIDQFGLYRGLLTLSDLKISLKPKYSLDWVQDKILQLTAYYIPIEALYPVEQSALIYLIGDGSYNEFLFTPEQMECYKDRWLERLSQVNSMMSLVA